MKALVVKSRLSALGLSKAAKMEQDARVRKRLQALALRKQGWLVCDVATALLVTARTVENWINRYNQEGRNGLKEQPRTGAPIKLKNALGFCRRIDAGADVKDNQVSTLHGKEIQRILKDDFGAEYALSSVYCLLHRLGYSSLKPRPYHAKADPAEQAAFKKALVSK